MEVFEREDTIDFQPVKVLNETAPAPQPLQPQGATTIMPPPAAKPAALPPPVPAQTRLAELKKKLRAKYGLSVPWYKMPLVWAGWLKKPTEIKKPEPAKVINLPG